MLDFGSGTATLSLMAKASSSGSESVGVDVDPRVVAIARRKAVDAGLEIQLDCYDGSSLPYPDRHFDRVISSLVFHHPSPQQKSRALNEIRRVLKPAGELHIADWGKARNAVMRGLFVLVQLLDGFGTTADNVAGLLPAYISRAGFTGVRETRTFTTVFGTLSLYRAAAPAVKTTPSQAYHDGEKR